MDREGLYAAAHAGDLDGLRRAADRERLDEPLNPLGWTALMAAAAQGHGDVVAWLLEAGARPDVVTEDGDSALSLAAARGHVAALRLLAQDEGVDVNRRDGAGWTPLMSAALRGHHRVVATLLERPDLAVNRSDVDGRTALIWAASAGHETAARLLAADDRVAVGRPAADGVSAADAARDAGLDDLADDLERLASERPDTPVDDEDLDTPPPAPPRPPDARPIREPTRFVDDG